MDFYVHFGLFINLIWWVTTKEFDIWNNERSGADLERDLRKIAPNSDLNRLPRVLNFFPVPFVEECKANDGRRRGTCINTYECRIQGGKSYGFCALGFGVCCVFTATCNQEAANNLTYFVNPNYPDLSKGMSSCSLTVKKIDSEVSQIRLDFIHFNLGQPNRQTGVCEEDIFSIKTKATRDVTLCGSNNGQHIYVDVDNVEDIEIRMNLSKKEVTRFWEIIITQVTFAERTPPGCFQYFTGTKGTIQTMNFADNGRHLANQDYVICMRQEEGMCSIAYEQCHENSFRIAGGNDAELDTNILEDGSGDGFVEGTFRALNMCSDKIVLPCDSEEFLMPDMVGSCSQIHCGHTLCPSGNSPCKIESSVTPFNIEVHFGGGKQDSSPEDNLGMCLNYEQLPCNN